MKRFRYFFLTVLLMACLCISVQAMDYSWTAPDDSYTLYFDELEDGTLSVHLGTYDSSVTLDIEIPAEMEGKKVSTIKAKGFDRSKYLKGTVTIPEGIVDIGASAFYNTGLTGELIIPNSVKRIGEHAFDGTGFTSLKLGSELESIGARAFCECAGLTGTLVLPDGVQSIGDSAFYMTGFTGELAVPGSVKTIGTHAFDGLGITSLTLNEGIESIGYLAFGNMSSVSGNLVIPKGVHTIGNRAFYNSSFDGALTFAGDVETIGTEAFVGTGFTSLTIGKNVQTIEEKAFYNCKSLTGDLVIGEGMKSIGSNAFYGTGFNGNLTLPDSLESVGESAFYKAGFTGDLTMNGIQEIGDQAFYYASFNGTLTLNPQAKVIGVQAFAYSKFTGDLVVSATEIKKEAFYGCTGFTGKLTIGEGCQLIEEKAFYRCTNLAGELTLPQTLKIVGPRAFAELKVTGGLTFGPELVSIGYSAFEKCTSLTGGIVFAETAAQGCTIGNSAFWRANVTGTVVFPEGLTTIGEGAFLWGSITGVVLPESLETIRTNAFYRSAIASEVIIPGNVKEIGKDAFYMCESLPSVVFRDGVEVIGERAFYQCTALENVTMASTIKTIRKEAFYSCKALKCELQLNDGLTSIGENAFYMCSSMTGNLHIPDSVTEIGKKAFAQCSALNGTLELPEGLTRIEAGVFQYCYNLTGELVLPEVLEYVGVAAFNGCRGFTGTLHLPDSLTYIDAQAFYVCSGFTGDLDLPDGITHIQADAFSSCDGLNGRLSLPQDLQYLGARAFAYSKGLSGYLTLPSELTYLGDEAFRYLENISFSTNLPDKLTYIGSYTFSEREDFIGRLELPETLTGIGDYAFYECSGLYGTIDLPDGLQTIGAWAFCRCTGLRGDLIVPPGVTTIENYAFYGCTGLTGTLKIPYGINLVGEFIFKESGFHDVWMPADLDGGEISTLIFYADFPVYYYGGTADLMYEVSGWRINTDTTICYYECYDAQGLDISGSSTITYQAGQTFTLEASYYNSEVLTDLSFTWISSSPDIVLLESSTDKVASTGYTARTTATFRALAEGTATVMVSGGGLSDSANVTVTDFKSIQFHPLEGQVEGKPVPVLVGESVTIQFDYVTSGDADAEMASIQWNAAADGVAISEIRNIAGSSRMATLTATVTGITAGDPIEITVFGPGNSKGSCQVVVLEDKITILAEDQTKPVTGEKAVYSAGTGEDFTIYLQYESAAAAEKVKEKLDGMKWTQATEDFMIHPEDRASLDANPVYRNSTNALPLNTSYEKTGDASYLVKVTFAAAQEGICGLEVQVGDYTTDTCMVQAAFDNQRYLAQLLHDATNPTTVDVYKMLKGDTPATVMLKILEEDGGYQAASLTWDALEIAFDMAEKPSSIYDLAVKEEDMYYGLLLEVLSGMMDEGNDTRFQDSVKFGNDLMDTFKDAFQMVYATDLANLDMDVVLSDAGKTRVLTEAFEAHYKVPNLAAKMMEKLDYVGTAVNEFQALEDRVSAAMMLQGISDAMENVLSQMLAESGNNAALQKAILNCMDQIGDTEAEMMEKIKDGTLRSVGTTSAKKIFDKYWKTNLDKVKLAHPEAAMVFAAYHGGTTLSNMLGATDATREEYYKLVALQDIKAAAQAAHDSISAGWEGDPATYLASVQMLFRIHLLDCDHALQYVDIADNALLSKAIEALGGTGFDRAEDAFSSFKDTVQVLYETYQIMWIDHVEADYPGVLLESGYEDAFAKIMQVSRETLFACPVEVYLMDGDTVVGYVKDGTVYTSAEDVTVTLDGDQKVITFLNGSGYTLKVVGTGEGTMNVTDIRYDDGKAGRTLEYNDLPVTVAGEYLSKRFNHLLDDAGETVDVHADSKDPAEYTLKLISGQADVTLARAGQNIAIMAVVPKGYTFAGWTCDLEDVVIEDAGNPVTTLRMPAGNVTVTAQLKIAGEHVPDDRLTLTDEQGMILREIPKANFTLRVAGESTCLLAVYDGSGKMLSVQIPGSADGLITAAMDNTTGEIERIALFQVDSMANPVPAKQVLEVIKGTSIVR